jgi:hypothetical protein
MLWHLLFWVIVRVLYLFVCLFVSLLVYFGVHDEHHGMFVSVLCYCLLPFISVCLDETSC